MTTMDDVFGNSSSETVVSVNDENEDDFSADISSNEDCDSSFADDVSEVSSNDVFYEAEVAAFEDPAEVQVCNRVSVIKSVAKEVEKCLGDNLQNKIFKVPLPPSSVSIPLRHTQSAAVVTKSPTEIGRPRAHSAAASSEAPVLKHAPAYQNIPINSQMYPTYVNLPPRKETRSPLKETIVVPNSAPSTPNGSHKIVSPRVNSSYIQLWSGVRQKRNLSESDSDEDDNSSLSSKPSEGGYVKMSSPYVRSPNSSMLCDLAQKIASYSGVTTKDIFCPFCPRPFSLKINLSHHIQAIHGHEVASVLCQKEDVPVQLCPLCHGRFFNLDLLPCHLLEFHRGSIVNLLNKHQCLDIEDDHIVNCPFCPKKIPNNKVGEDVLLFHLLQFHNHDYENLINTLFQPIVSNVREEIFKKLSTENLTKLASLKPNESSTPGLSIKFKSLSCHLSNESRCKTDNETWNSHSVDPGIDHSCRPPFKRGKGILRSAPFLPEKPHVKRELRFSVPPVTSEEIYTPETPESSPDKDEGENEETSSIAYYHHYNGKVPVRVDSLSSVDFIEMTHKQPCRKKRRLSLGIKSKKKRRENFQTFNEVFDGLKTSNCLIKPTAEERIIPTATTRTFRRPKPVAPPRVPTLPSLSSNSSKKGLETGKSFVKTRSSSQGVNNKNVEKKEFTNEDEEDEHSPFSTMKLYAPLRMFRCNGCRTKFSDNESLNSHIKCKHKGFFGFLLPHFGCGICSAKFYENKFLVKHCLQHHTSLLEIRSPKKHKITIYRFSQD